VPSENFVLIHPKPSHINAAMKRNPADETDSTVARIWLWVWWYRNPRHSLGFLSTKKSAAKEAPEWRN